MCFFLVYVLFVRWGIVCFFMDTCISAFVKNKKKEKKKKKKEEKGGHFEHVFIPYPQIIHTHTPVKNIVALPQWRE